MGKQSRLDNLSKRAKSLPRKQTAASNDRVKAELIALFEEALEYIDKGYIVVVPQWAGNPDGTRWVHGYHVNGDIDRSFATLPEGFKVRVVIGELQNIFYPYRTDEEARANHWQPDPMQPESTEKLRQAIQCLLESLRTRTLDSWTGEDNFDCDGLYKSDEEVGYIRL